MRSDIVLESAAVESQERALPELAAAALRSGRPRAAHGLYEQLLHTAPDDEARGQALAGLGFVAQRSGRPREAVRLLEEAAAAFSLPIGELPELADALGRSYAALGELGRAVSIFEQSLAHAKATGDRTAHVRFAALLSYSLTDCGRFDEAERALAEVRDAAAGIDDPKIRARAEWVYARLRGEQGRTELALEHAQRAFDLFRETEARTSLALAYELVAALLNDLGRADEALTLLREGMPLMLEAGTPLQVAHYRIEEARALAQRGESEGAAAVAMRVAAQLDGTHPGDAGRAYVLLGEIFDRLGDVARARQLYETGISLLSKQGPTRYLANAYRRLAELFEAEYRTEDAVAVLKRALTIQSRIERAADAH
jgi:tetratricopeptide (TPR) repeat protein